MFAVKTRNLSEFSQNAVKNCFVTLMTLIMLTVMESLVGPSERRALQRVLTLSPSRRRHHDLLPVHRVLQKVEFVAALEPRVQEALATIVHYENFEPFTTIFEEGELGGSFYIILSGAFAVQKRTEDGNTTTIVTLTSGQSFGELALVEEKGRRAAAVMTTTGGECLTIDGNAYRSYLATIHRAEINRKIDVLRHQPVFAGWNAADLENLASVMSVKKVPYDEAIVQQGQDSDAVYFIKSGEVRVVRGIRPTKKLIHELNREPLLTARLSSSSREVEQCASLPKRLITSARSSLPTPRSSGRPTKTVDPAGHEDIFLELATMGPFETFGKVASLKGCASHPATIISNTFTELLVLTRHDLLNKVDVRTRRKFEEYKAPTRSDRELLNDLFESFRWEKYKTKLVQRTLAENRKEFYLINRAATEFKSLWKP